MGWRFLYLLDFIRVIRWLWDRVLGGAVPLNISCHLLFVLIRTVDWGFHNNHLVLRCHLPRPYSYFSSLNLWLKSFVRHNDRLLLFFTSFIVLTVRLGAYLVRNRLWLAPAAHWPDFELYATPLVSLALLVLVTDFADRLPRVFFTSRLKHKPDSAKLLAVAFHAPFALALRHSELFLWAGRFLPFTCVASVWVRPIIAKRLWPTSRLVSFLLQAL